MSSFFSLKWDYIVLENCISCQVRFSVVQVNGLSATFVLYHIGTLERLTINLFLIQLINTHYLPRYTVYTIFLYQK